MKDAAKIYGEALYELARSEELDGQGESAFFTELSDFSGFR